MGQKVHPIGYRLGITQKHLNYWYGNSQNVSYWLQDVEFLRNLIKKAFSKAGIAEIEIRKYQYISKVIFIKIFTANPHLIIEQNISHTDFFRKFEKNLIQRLQDYYKKRNLVPPENIYIHFYIEQINTPNSNASLIADKLINDLEHRKPFRRSLVYFVNKAKEAGVRGIKIQISGRLNGADIARSIKLQYGQVPLQTLRAKIDYVSKFAKTKYGLLGIKVWVFHGELVTPFSNL